MRLRYRYGGGRPPASLETLELDADGRAEYLAANPWPTRPPFDEIGVYRADVGAERATRLAELARAAVRGHAADSAGADSGSAWVEVDGSRVYWSPTDPPAGSLADELGDVIGAVREHPLAAVRAVVSGGELRVTNPGTEAVRIASADLHAGDAGSSSLLAFARLPPRSLLEAPVDLDPGAELGFGALAGDAALHLSWAAAGEQALRSGWLLLAG